MKLHIAIPLLNELENLPKLLHDIRNQTHRNFQLWFCVNQPDDWHFDESKKHICQNNSETLNILKSISDLPITILDYSTIGKGWKGDKVGVGFARKALMDSINQCSVDDDIIISLDGDTGFGPYYFASVIDNFRENPEAPAISIPYYHLLTGNDIIDRAILRYEIYMRYYEFNLRRILSPYAFTALGSAIAVKIWAYRSIGGMTPKKSGEDFYFLQKLVKYRPILTWNNEKVFPAARFSDRVFFGTGPALIKGASGDWSSYPIYAHFLFDKIDAAFHLFDNLYDIHVETPIDLVFENDWSSPLRKNSRTKEVFIKACHDKFDGLRTLQFLKESQKQVLLSDSECLVEFSKKHCPDELSPLIGEGFSFETASICKLNQIRDFFVSKVKD